MTIDEILKVTGGTLLQGNPNQKIKRIEINSKKIKKGDLFFAYQKGHHYLKEAKKRGAKALIVSKKEQLPSSIAIIYVEDSLKAYHALAHYYKTKHHVLCIAVTGSVGKSTTKELLAKLLENDYNICKNIGNKNNHLGLPQTIFTLRKEDQILLVELGMNHLGEISKLSKLCEPDFGIITNIGSSHIGYLKSKKEILKAKMELIDGMNQGVLFVNGEDSYLKKIKNLKITCRKWKRKNPLFQIKNVKDSLEGLSFFVCYQKKEYPVFMEGINQAFLPNIFLSIATALTLGVSMEAIQKQLVTFKMLEHRMQKIECHNFTLLDDCYNASYESYHGLIQLLKKEKRKKIFLAADMLEYGEKSNYYHKKVVKELKKIKNCECLFYGEEMEKASKTKQKFPDLESLENYLSKKDLKDHLIILKGSRGMKLDQLLPFFKNVA